MSKNIKISNIDSDKLLNGEMNEEGIKIGNEFCNFKFDGVYDCVYAILEVDENNVVTKPEDADDDWETTIPLKVFVRKDGINYAIEHFVLPSPDEEYEDRLIDKVFPFNEIKQVEIPLYGIIFLSIMTSILKLVGAYILVLLVIVLAGGEEITFEEFLGDIDLEKFFYSEYNNSEVVEESIYINKFITTLKSIFDETYIGTLINLYENCNLTGENSYKNTTKSLINSGFIDDTKITGNSIYNVFGSKLMVKIPEFYIRTSFYKSKNNKFERRYEVISPAVYNEITNPIIKQQFFKSESFNDSKELFLSSMPESTWGTNCVFGSKLNYINPLSLPLSDFDLDNILNETGEPIDNLKFGGIIPTPVLDETTYQNVEDTKRKIILNGESNLMNVETWYGVVLYLLKLYTGYLNPSKLFTQYETGMNVSLQSSFVTYYDDFYMDLLDSDTFKIFNPETFDLEFDWNKFVFTKQRIRCADRNCFNSSLTENELNNLLSSNNIERFNTSYDFMMNPDCVAINIDIPKSYNGSILTNLFLNLKYTISGSQYDYSFVQQKFYVRLSDDLKPKPFSTINKQGVMWNALFYLDNNYSDESINRYVIKVFCDSNGYDVHYGVRFDLLKNCTTYIEDNVQKPINEQFVKRYFNGKTICFNIKSYNEDDENPLTIKEAQITALLDENLVAKKGFYHINDYDTLTQNEYNRAITNQLDIPEFFSQFGYNDDERAVCYVSIDIDDTNDNPGNIIESNDTFYDITKKNMQYYNNFSLLYFKNFIQPFRKTTRINEFVYNSNLIISSDECCHDPLPTPTSIDESKRNFEYYYPKRMSSNTYSYKGVFLENLNMGYFKTSKPELFDNTVDDSSTDIKYLNITVNTKSSGTKFTNNSYTNNSALQIRFDAIKSHSFGLQQFVCDKKENLIKFNDENYYYDKNKYFYEFPAYITLQKPEDESTEDYIRSITGSCISINPYRTNGFTSNLNKSLTDQTTVISNLGSICSTGSMQNYTHTNTPGVSSVNITKQTTFDLYSINVIADNHFTNYPDEQNIVNNYKNQIFSCDYYCLRYKEFWFDQNIMYRFTINIHPDKITNQLGNNN